MPQLQTHDLLDLVGLEKEPKTNCGIVIPGKPVQHKNDSKSYGMVLSRRWGPVGGPMQCEVLWSKEPQIPVKDDNIFSHSRKLRATWTVQEPPQIYGLSSGNVVSRSSERYEVEEEYEELSYEEVRRLHEAGADIRLHDDGRVTVKRKTNEEPGPDDRITRRTFRSR